MLTNSQALMCAYAAFQSHYKANVINDENIALLHWRNNPAARALWLGLTHGILANAAIFITETEQGLAKKQIDPAEAIKRSADPSRIVQAMKDRNKAQSSAAGPFGPAGTAHHAPTQGASPDGADAAAMGLAPGLAIGRCTETPTDTQASHDSSTDAGSSDAGGSCD